MKMAMNIVSKLRKKDYNQLKQKILATLLYLQYLIRFGSKLLCLSVYSLFSFFRVTYFQSKIEAARGFQSAKPKNHKKMGKRLVF